ncbi:4-hydroxy-tetrahydrodipicolinate synthase [Wenzhouxiangella sp. XN79A]|uniref:4-hydroxy-tetrahydrodipicolinate synthase n=1 Tax=Wenzhouxiangella sp. XN79A TaxID=2724193 RepID=UPI00144AF5B9|nr:4-hydroxy-tetrahydrodipicolinate synthase [Wenzhouxiangella sp. XN79A]NKI35452.1 4-hydroxy-tetrahydrodipicolinate synthase [Wenzhouxiangella sp. XN79A]
MKTLDDFGLTGSLVALVTPMHADGALDESAWTRLLDWHAEAGTDGVIVGGTTGESVSLRAEERDRLLEHALERIGDRVRVIAGTGAAATAAAIEQSRRAAALGAHAVLVVTPYYNRPPQRGLAAHYRAIAEACAAPLILYNVPGRTAVDLAPETTIELAGHERIVGIKEAVADMGRVRHLVEAGVGVLSGDDPTARAAIDAGAVGVISVAANIVPDRFAAMCHAALDGRRDRAEAIDAELRPLYRFLGIESNPVPAKWLLAELGRIDSGIRLPLVPLDDAHHETGRALLRSLTG